VVAYVDWRSYVSPLTVTRVTIGGRHRPTDSCAPCPHSPTTRVAPRVPAAGASLTVTLNVMRAEKAVHNRDLRGETGVDEHFTCSPSVIERFGILTSGCQ
jgi:hypothetical protein